MGSWLVRTLIKEDSQVVALIRDHNPRSDLFRSGNNKYVECVQGSLEDFASIERAINECEIDTVFHLGAQTIVGTAWRSPLSTFESNIRGTYNLLEACHRHRNLVQRIIVASSDKAYGSSDILPYTEEMPLCGRHPYDVSKTCTDLLSLSYFHTYHLPIAIARCGNIYGGGDLNWSRIVPGTIRSYLNNEAPLIRSNGKLTRDYIYVEDVVGAYLTLGENLHRPEVQGNAFNFAPNRPLSVTEIIETIQRKMERFDLDPKILNIAKSEIQDQSLSCVKAKELLNWQPQFSIEEGIAVTIPWYEAFLNERVYA